MRSDADATLVAAARRGEIAAFAALLTRHRPLLVAVCRRQLGSGAAEDAAQEAAIQALLGIDRLRKADRFGPWLAGIGLNVCRSWLRDRSRADWSWEAMQGGTIPVELADNRPGPPEVAEELETSRHIRNAIDRLPAGQRAAILAFYLADLTQAETADVLGIPVGALKTRLHKARAALRPRLVPLWNDAPAASTTLRERNDKMESVQDNPSVEVRVADVRRTAADSAMASRACTVVLEEIGGSRRLLGVQIGPFEGEAMAMTLEGVNTQRPITYAFAAQLLHAAGARLVVARITRLTEQTFYAIAVIEGPNGMGQVDARPSDAINLALLTGAPIRVAAELLEGAAAPAAGTVEKPVQGGGGAAGIVAELRLARPADIPQPAAE